MLTRVATSIYSINRHIERAENTARLVNVTFNLLLDFPNRPQQQWQSIIEISGDLSSFQERYDQPTRDSAIQFLIFDPDHPNSLISCLQAARETARTIRQFISEAVWQQVNTFYLIVKDTNPEQMTGTLVPFLIEVQRASYLFVGAMNETMSHDEGWHFGKSGRLLERINKTSRLLSVKYSDLLASEVASNVGNELGWMALLKSASAYEMYRKHHHRLTSQGIAEFLILGREFPRSIRFCLGEAEASLQKITRTSTGNNGKAERLGQLLTQLDGVTIEEILPELPEFLSNLRQQIDAVDHEISNTFFALDAN